MKFDFYLRRHYWKSSKLAVTIFIALFTLTGASYVVFGELIDSQRWDLRMIEEAPIWDYLLTNYGFAPRGNYWPGRKTALQTIIDKFPDSRWADDAALILACEKASVDGQITEAIVALRQVIGQYPSEHTIVSYWIPDIGCRLNATWLMGRSIVSVNPDHSISMSFPFDKYGDIPQQDREMLAYFEHLDKYPILTKDGAQLIIANMLSKQADFVAAIAELEALIARYPNLAAITAADREAADRPDGYLIGHEFPGESRPIWRPQYSAYIQLMDLYQSQGNKDKAIATGLALASYCSPDGWHWGINQRVGDFCAKNGRWAEAEKQYQLALEGCRKVIEDFISRKKAFGELPPPGSTSWRQQILEVWSIGACLTKLENLVLDAQARQ